MLDVMIGFVDVDVDEVTELVGVVWVVWVEKVEEVEAVEEIDDVNWVFIGGIGSVLGIVWVWTFSWLNTTDSETACKLSRSIFILLLMGSKLN